MVTASDHSPRVRLLTASFAALGLAFGLWLTSPRAAESAETTAPADVATATTSYSTVEFDWIDSARGRAVPVRLYLPAVATGTRIPLVVFSHGIGGSRRGYSYLGHHFAANGIASMHVQHTGSDRSVWAGNPFALVTRLHAAAQEREAADRAADLRFALDTLLAGELGSRVDRSHIVVAGHSYGANTALLVAGARVERDGRTLDFRDPRYSAAILISAPPFYGETDLAKILTHVTVPTLHITATEDVIQIPGYYSGADDRVAVFDAIGSTRKTLAVFTGGSHSMFTDRTATGGAQLNAEVKAATRELSSAFLVQVFGGAAEALDRWTERYRAIVSRYSTLPLR